MSKKILWLVVSVLMVLSLVMASCTPPPSPPEEAPPPPPAPEKIVLKTATAWGRDTDMVKIGYFDWEAKVNERVSQQYPGQLEIKYIGGPEAIATMDQGAALKDGVVDVILTAALYVGSIVPEAGAMMFSQFTPWEDRENGAYDFWNKLFKEEMNSVFLGRHGRDTTFHFFLNKEITKPDLTGLVLRTPPGLFSALTEALGGAPVTMPPGDVYTALQRGVIDGYLTVYLAPPDFGWQELTKYVVMPGFYTDPFIFLMNLDTWNKLPPHLQTLLIDVSKELEREAWTLWNTVKKEVEQKYADAGIKTIEFSEADAKSYVDTAYRVGWEDAEKKFPESVPELKKLLIK